MAYEDEWNVILKRGRRAIRGGELDEQAPSYEVCTWRCPSFEPQRSWTVWRARREESNHRLVRVTWDRALDWKRLADPMMGLRVGTSPEPTLTTDEAFVDARLWDEREHALRRRLIVPAFLPDDRIGLDGTRSGIHLPGHILGIHLEWWERGPEGFESVAAAIRELQAWLDGSFDDAAS